jgi:hypothetical protein
MGFENVLFLRNCKFYRCAKLTWNDSMVEPKSYLAVR